MRGTLLGVIVPERTLKYTCLATRFVVTNVNHVNFAGYVYGQDVSHKATYHANNG